MSTERTTTRRRFLRGVAGTGALAMLAGCQSDDGDIEVYTETDHRQSSTPVATFDTVQGAVDAARPGETVTVPPGTYAEKVTTTRSGREDAPIRITGPESAVITGNRDEYGILRINHSHVHFVGFSVEGLLDRERPRQLDSYINGQLIQTRPPTSTDEYLQDIVIAPDKVGYSRKSLIGLERTDGAVIGPTRVSGPAGAQYVLGDARSRNGELLYIGTADTNLGSDWHPWTEPDRTRNVRVHHIDNSAGHAHSEAADIKEGTRNITVEYMTDRNAGVVSLDATEASVSFKSRDSTVRWCDIAESTVGVEFAPSGRVRNNNLYGCRFRDIEHEPVKFEPPATRQRQGRICGNTVGGTLRRSSGRCGSDVPDGQGVGYDATETPSGSP